MEGSRWARQPETKAWLSATGISFSDSHVNGELGSSFTAFKMAKHDEQESLGEGHASSGESTDYLKKAGAKPGVDIPTLIVLIQGK